MYAPDVVNNYSVLLKCHQDRGATFSKASQRSSGTTYVTAVSAVDAVIMTSIVNLNNCLFSRVAACNATHGFAVGILSVCPFICQICAF